jgi:HEAT repeat protein
MEDDGPAALAGLAALPLRPAIRELQGLLPSAEPLVRFRAATALGRLGVALAREDLEAGRDLLRRLMWSLNDESGGIGWGAPEAMAEIMAGHEGLAAEFGHLLVSYLVPGANRLECEPLARGALWGLCRLLETRPDLAREAEPELVRLLREADPERRGLAALALARLGTRPTAINPGLARDETEIGLYAEWRLSRVKVKDLAG